MTQTKEVRRILIGFGLQLFAEGAAAGGDGGQGEGSGENGVASGVPGRGKNANPLADVRYGVQEAEVQNATAQTEEPAQVTPEQRMQAFESLIKGEYKDLYDARVQDTVQRRLKASKETTERYEALTPTLDMLYSKYGIEYGNIEALNSAIQDDSTFYEDEAIEKGLTVKQLKEIKKLERENSALQKQMEQRANQQRAEQDLAKWMEQAKDAEKVFPGLNLRTELQNPQFVQLLKDNVDLQTAYFAVHHRELVPQAMQFAARDAEQKITNKIAASGARPAENGTHSQSPINVKSDVRTLSKADRAEINRRVARGEKIRF